MNTQDEENISRILSVRVSENIYRAYEQIQMLYAIKQSDLIRMAPLLLALLAEGSLAHRRKKVQDVGKALQNLEVASDEFRKKFREMDRESTAIENNEIMGSIFIEYLRELADKVGNNDVIKRSDIEEGEDGLPKYSISQQQVLRQAAHEIADLVSFDKISDLLSEDANNPYDGQLLVVSGKKLGKVLDDHQKSEVRDQFKKALQIRMALQKPEAFKNSDGGLWEAAYEVARDRVRPEDIQPLLEQIGSEDTLDIPHRYDGQLLAISRKKLGKPLSSGEKSTVRKLFHKALKMVKDYSS